MAMPLFYNTIDVTTDHPWHIWVSNQTATSSTYSTIATDMIWQYWNENQTATTLSTISAYEPRWVRMQRPRQRTEEEQLQYRQRQLERERAVEERHREAMRVAKEESEKRKEADAKAMALLRENLTPQQLEDLDKNKWFLVEGGKSKKTYRINATRYAGNIYELDGAKEVASYCVHANDSIPLGDQLLTQTISLRHDEDHIIGKANRRALG